MCALDGTRDLNKEDEVPPLLPLPTGVKAGFEKTARARMNGFSKPTVMTRKGRASDSKIGLMLIPSVEAAKSERRKPNTPYTRTEQPSHMAQIVINKLMRPRCSFANHSCNSPSQNLLPNLRMLMNKLIKVKCIKR